MAIYKKILLILAIITLPLGLASSSYSLEFANNFKNICLPIKSITDKLKLNPNYLNPNVVTNLNPEAKKALSALLVSDALFPDQFNLYRCKFRGK